MTELIDFTKAFGSELHPGDCCDCCDGYCPRDDFNFGSKPHFEPLLRLTSTEASWVTDRYICIREDRLTPAPEEAHIRDLNTSPIDKGPMYIPDERPDEGAEILISSRMWVRIDDAGLTSSLVLGKALKHKDGAGASIVHIYDGEEHIGWVTTARPGKGITHADYLRYAAIAIGAEVTVDQVADVLRAALAEPTESQ